MRIGQMTVDPAAGLDELVRQAKASESNGFSVLAMPNIFGYDAIGALTVVGRETERIELVTAVVPMHPRHPVAIAQQALTAQAAARGRFSLGIGLSHKIVIENMLGLSYTRHAAYTREYLSVLKPLLAGEQVSFQGEFFRVNAQLNVPDVTDVPVLVAALGPRMLQVTGELADGTITWMTGIKTLDGFTVPTLRAARRRRAGRSRASWPGSPSRSRATRPELARWPARSSRCTGRFRPIARCWIAKASRARATWPSPATSPPCAPSWDGCAMRA